jgi:hypothetical protein
MEDIFQGGPKSDISLLLGNITLCRHAQPAPATADRHGEGLDMTFQRLFEALPVTDDGVIVTDTRESEIPPISLLVYLNPAAHSHDFHLEYTDNRFSVRCFTPSPMVQNARRQRYANNKKWRDRISLPTFSAGFHIRKRLGKRLLCQGGRRPMTTGRTRLYVKVHCETY